MVGILGENKRLRHLRTVPPLDDLGVVQPPREPPSYCSVPGIDSRTSPGNWCRVDIYYHPETTTVEGNTGKIVPLSLVKKEIQQAKTLVWRELSFLMIQKSWVVFLFGTLCGSQFTTNDSKKIEWHNDSIWVWTWYTSFWSRNSSRPVVYQIPQPP